MASTPAQTVRARLVWTEAEDRDDLLDHQILIDLVIDTHTQRVLGKQPAFGIYGSPVREESYPFVLKVDGTVDYGGNADDDLRLNWTNIREKPIRIGELATYREGDEEWCCRVVSVTDLAMQ